MDDLGTPPWLRKPVYIGYWVLYWIIMDLYVVFGYNIGSISYTLWQTNITMESLHF